ncbi:MAG: peroxiredoxin family protein [Pseudomonadota bacterium]
MMKPLLAAIALSTAFAAPAIADGHGHSKSETAMIGPKVGAMAPSLDGTVSVVAEGVTPAAGEAGRVLVFVRSADWCPYCKTQLVELESIAGTLAEEGWALEAISYDSPETLAEFATDNEISFTLRADEGSAVITEFGLLNTDVREGSRSYGIPHPAVVFVRKEGTVAAVLREEGYSTRPSTEAITEAAKMLNKVSVG